MARRTTRGHIDNSKVLPRLGESRKGAIEVHGVAINSRENNAAGEVLDAVTES